MSYLSLMKDEVCTPFFRGSDKKIDVMLALTDLDLKQFQVAKMLGVLLDISDNSSTDLDTLHSAIASARALIISAAESFDAIEAYCSQAEAARQRLAEACAREVSEAA